MKREDLQERLFHLENGIVKLYIMKTCKYGCGKMKEGGKVTAVKKMKAGGSSKGCPSGQCPHKTMPGICIPCPLSSLSAKIGVGTTLTGLAAIGTKAIADANKKRKAVTEIKKSNPGMTRKEAKKQYKEKTEAELTKNRRGGAAKKYAMGGSTIVGMPKYSNNPRSDAGRMLKAGGATSNKKFAALAPPYDKATFADRIAGAKKNARKK
jgi:hypothetical protein